MTLTEYLADNDFILDEEFEPIGGFHCDSPDGRIKVMKARGILVTLYDDCNSIVCIATFTIDTPDAAIIAFIQSL